MTKSDGAFIKVSGTNVHTLIENNVSIGRPLVDAENASLKTLIINANMVFSDAEHHITLGELLNVEISDNLFSTKLPFSIAKELEQAAISAEHKNSLMSRLSKSIKPKDLLVIDQLIQRMHQLFFT